MACDQIIAKNAAAATYLLGRAMTLPARYLGFVDELSPMHASGWILSTSDPGERVEYNIVLPRTGEVVARGVAGHYRPGMMHLGATDCLHGFYSRLPRRLSEEDREQMQVCTVTTAQILPRNRPLVSDYRPIRCLIMDIVNNCNLRCPFCVYDYAGVNRTNMMSEATIEAATPLAAFAEAFWFSCLHEPTLHPRLTDFVMKVPREHRSRIFYTTNLAKRLPARYFTDTANSGIHFVNVSVESLKPAVYERMRKGARYHIFKENLDKLVAAFAAAEAPPQLRYVTLAYRSTYRQLPEMIDHLLMERGGNEIEIRYTFDYAHLPREFCHAEFLRRDEWLWLRDALAHHTPPRVQLVLPPGLDDSDFDSRIFVDSAALPVNIKPHSSDPLPPASGEPVPGSVPGSYDIRLFWDGRLDVIRRWSDDSPPRELHVVTRNVRDIGDAEAFIASLPI